MVTVKYWIGTTQVSGLARTYQGAMRLAERNQNAFSPKFFDAEGVELYDDGQGLAYPDPETTITPNGTTVERRVYAV